VRPERSARMRSVFLLGLLAATAAHATKPMSPRGEQCTAASDCVITDFSGCCGGCCPQARAMSKAELEQQQKRCAVIDCEAPMCAAVVCEAGPSAASLEAACSNGRCVALPKSRAVAPPAAECTSDRQCTVDYPQPGPSAGCRSSPCGCCPGTEPVAVPVERAERTERERRPRPARPAQSPPEQPKKFGLSEGKADAPAPPACSPCPGPRPARAVCRANRCVLQ
jgi:hypothetical protein